MKKILAVIALTLAGTFATAPAIADAPVSPITASQTAVVTFPRVAVTTQAAERAVEPVEPTVEPVEPMVPSQGAVVQVEPVVPVESAKMAVEPVSPVVVPPVPVEPVAAPVVPAWITGTLAGYGVGVPSNVRFEVTESGNCGGVGGGCTTVVGDGTVIVTLSPALSGTPQGIHVLLHEMAHVLYGMNDECAADRYAHSLHGMNMWSYQECAIWP